MSGSEEAGEKAKGDPAAPLRKSGGKGAADLRRGAAGPVDADPGKRRKTLGQAFEEEVAKGSTWAEESSSWIFWLFFAFTCLTHTIMLSFQPLTYRIVETIFGTCLDCDDLDYDRDGDYDSLKKAIVCTSQLPKFLAGFSWMAIFLRCPSRYVWMVLSSFEILYFGSYHYTTWPLKTPLPKA